MAAGTAGRATANQSQHRGNRERGSLAVNGAGTAIQHVGPKELSLIGGSGSAQVTITGGAIVTYAGGGTLGASTGGDASLTVSGTGSQFIAAGELDIRQHRGCERFIRQRLRRRLELQVTWM